MYDFEFHAPTKIHFGVGAEKKVGSELKALNLKNVMVLYGGGSAVRSGLIGRITADLEANGVPYLTRGGVEPNPKLGFVLESAKICNEKGVDFILAVGGGSVIDSAKAIGMAAKCENDPWLVMTHQAEPPEDIIPVGAVPTLAATGSEMGWGFVISNPEVRRKQASHHAKSYPVVSFLNPELTFSTPPFQTACGIVDSMMHTFERYFYDVDEFELTDRIAESVLISIKRAGVIAMAEPNNYEARATLLWASSLSHNGLTGCGRHIRMFAVHPIENTLSGMYDHVAHGAGLSVLYPAWAKLVYKYDIKRFARLAKVLWDVPEDYGTEEEIAAKGIEEMIAFFRSLGMPTTMRELDIPASDFEAMADHISRNGKFATPSYIPIGREEMLAMFKLAE
ncbi:MAG: iron-containing alcohol dehydrogenase [Oscillospiraceae bacterium]